MKRGFNVTVDGISIRTHTGDYITPKTNTVHATGFYGEDIEFIVPSNEAGFFLNKKMRVIVEVCD